MNACKHRPIGNIQNYQKGIQNPRVVLAERQTKNQLRLKKRLEREGADRAVRRVIVDRHLPGQPARQQLPQNSQTGGPESPDFPDWPGIGNVSGQAVVLNIRCGNVGNQKEKKLTTICLEAGGTGPNKTAWVE